MPCPTCEPGQKCQQETCVADPCTDVQIDTCAQTNRVCDPGNPAGGCAEDQCASSQVTCPLPSVCDPITGTCADDPCRLINCPALSTCIQGFCMYDEPAQSIVGIDGGAPPPPGQPDLSQPVIGEPKVITDHGPCQCALGTRRPAPIPALLAVLVLGLALRRRGRLP